MIRKLLALTVFSASLTAQVDESGAAKTSFSLAEAQMYAKENAYSLEDKQIEVEKARQTIRQTASRGLPQVSGALDFTYNAQIAQQPVPAEFFGGQPGTFQTVAFGTEFQNVASLNVNQLILDGSYFVALQATQVFKDVARLDKELSELQIVRDVAQSYYGVLIAQQTLDVVKENLVSLQKNFEETKALYEQGFTEEQDMDQLELLVSNLENNRNRAERQVEVAKMLLNFNMGRDVRAELVLTDDIDKLIVGEEILTSNNFSLESNLQYKMVETQEIGMGLNVKNEKWKNYPTLSGFLRHGQSNFTNDFDQAWSTDVYWIPNTSLGFSLQWNLFQGLNRAATVEKAKLDLEKAQVAVDQVQNSLWLQYQQAKSNYEYAFDAYNTEKRNVELSKRIRNKTRVKYQEGISSSLELTQAENQYLQSQQNYLNATQSLLNAKEELLLAIGKKSN